MKTISDKYIKENRTKVFIRGYLKAYDFPYKSTKMNNKKVLRTSIYIHSFNRVGNIFMKVLNSEEKRYGWK